MFITESNLAAVLGVSLATVQSWSNKGRFPVFKDDKGNNVFNMEDLIEFDEIHAMVKNTWDIEAHIVPARNYTSVELFAGGGGLALGMEKAGFKHVLLNEFDTKACDTLRVNRPQWNVIEGDVRHIDFSPLRDKVDFLSGGFPCQAFSFAGKQGGFNDIRGTLFFELARAVKEIRPKVFMAENVKGLVSHDNGKTFATICNVISELGYKLVTPRILKAFMFQVPQKRERLILIAIRNDLADNVSFNWPSPYERVLTLKDAFYKGVIYDSETPYSMGMEYPEKKRKVMELVPEGGDWRNLPEQVAEEYMGGSWKLGGGKTGMARRLSLDEPSLTLTCSPCQKQTERCHPLETRPLTIREYARIQTFPDEWLFQGTMATQYKQIGNAVPVNLAWAIGRSIIRLLNDINELNPEIEQDCSDAVAQILRNQAELIVVKDNATQTSTVKKGIKQLNLFDLFQDFADTPVLENEVSETIETYRLSNTSSQSKSRLLKMAENVLVGYIKSDYSKEFESGNATSYFTGKKFPACVRLNQLKYFVPYIKGKGIRDVYAIKSIRVSNYADLQGNQNANDYRLTFDIEYIDKVESDYKKLNLDIWHTYKILSLQEL